MPTLTQEKRQTNLLPLIIVIVLAGIGGVAAWYFFIHAGGQPPQAKPEPTFATSHWPRWK